MSPTKFTVMQFCWDKKPYHLAGKSMMVEQRRFLCASHVNLVCSYLICWSEFLNPKPLCPGKGADIIAIGQVMMWPHCTLYCYKGTQERGLGLRV